MMGTFRMGGVTTVMGADSGARWSCTGYRTILPGDQHGKIVDITEQRLDLGDSFRWTRAGGTDAFLSLTQ